MAIKMVYQGLWIDQMAEQRLPVQPAPLQGV